MPLRQEDIERINPMDIADNIWNKTNPMVTSTMNKTSYLIGVCEGVKYSRNHEAEKANELVNALDWLVRSNPFTPNEELYHEFGVAINNAKKLISNYKK